MKEVKDTLRISDESFVKQWATAFVDQVPMSVLAKRIKLSYKEVWNLSQRLSANGVKLPKLWGMRKVSSERVMKLNAIISKVTGEDS